MHFSSGEIDINITRWYYPQIGYGFYLPPVEEATISGLKRGLSTLNTHLSANTFLVGHCITLGDIVMACNLHLCFSRCLTKDFKKEFPHVERYFWTMVNHKNFKKILGEDKQVDVVPPVVQANKKPVQVKEKNTKPKEEPKKESAKPKVEGPPIGEEEEEALKPKPKNSLDIFPPSKMILDEWKRLYSNTKTNFCEIAIKGFWDMYDPEGYSLWFCE